MLKIAIVDDMELDRENISQMLHKIGDMMNSEFDIREFESGYSMF